MKTLGLYQSLLGLILFCGIVFAFHPSVTAQETNFSCGAAIHNQQTVPATLAFSRRGGSPVHLIYWISEYFSRSGSTPQQRCEITSERLQTYYDNGLLQRQYIRTGMFNNYGVICITRTVGGECLESDILITLLPGVDRFNALSNLFDLNRIAAGRPLYLTDDLIFYTDREAYVSFSRFFEKLSD